MTTVDTTTGEIVADLDSVEARAITNRIKDAAESIWSLLLEAHDRKAWKALAYRSWRDYAMTEFGMGQSQAYRLLDQARVIQEIESVTGFSPNGEISESAARDIKPHLEAVKAGIAEVVEPTDSPEVITEKVKDVISSTRETTKAAKAKAPNRRALTDQFFDAATDLTRVADRIARLAEDDRFTRNANEIATSYRSDLVRAVDAVRGVINRLS